MDFLKTVILVILIYVIPPLLERRSERHQPINCVYETHQVTEVERNCLY